MSGPMNREAARLQPQRSVTAFLRAAGRGETPYLEPGGQFGWLRPDGRRVHVDALSGGEWNLFAAALVAAMVDSTADAELRLALVDAGECDPPTLAAVLRGASAMPRVTWVVATWATPESVPDDWQVVRPDGNGGQRR